MLFPSRTERARGQDLFTGKVEIKVEILNPWRYAAITVGCRMTHRTRDTRIDRICDRLSRDRSSAIYPLTTHYFSLLLFGITSNALVRSSQSSSGPAGGASDGYGLGRGAAGPAPVYDYRGRGTPSHRLGRIHPYVRSCSATGTDRERSDWRT